MSEYLNDNTLTESTDQSVHIVEDADAIVSEVVVSEENAALSVEVADGRTWYILQCYSGHEYKVKERIEKLMAELQFSQRILRVLVPEEETIEIKNNTRTEKKTKIYPGYVFIQMIMDDEGYYEVRKLAGVVKFIGSKTMPVPVTDEEILKVLRKIGDKTKKVDVDFELDDNIKIVAGPFRGYNGPIAEINAEKGSLKVLISVFGRETPVTLDFSQVEKAL